MILLSDICIVCLSYYFSYFSRFGGAIPENSLGFFYNSLPMVILIKIYFLHDLGLYKASWRYTSIYEVVALFKATIISSAGVLTVIWLSGFIAKLPRTTIILDWCFSFLLLGAVRIIPRLAIDGLSEPVWKYVAHFFKFHNFRPPHAKDKATNVLIFGAGDAGQMIVREMKSKSHLGYNIVAFIDDNPNKKGRTIHGVEVYGDRSALNQVIETKKVDQIVISLPTLRGKELQEIITLCEATGKKVLIVPSIPEIVGGNITVSSIRDIRIEDLLGRDAIDLDTKSICDYLKGQTVLVTGAGGSIGSELCRQILKYSPRQVILLGRGEHSIFKIHNELQAKYPHLKFPQIIGDVINKIKIQKIFEIYRPQIVFHAGADKHVPLMEMNPDEAVLNNIIGTRNLIEVAEQFHIQKVICVSTDKAVNPTSMMGACKRVAETLIQNRGRLTKTSVMAVRFGNVLGSRGSVIPLFEKQIKCGGPLTVTHKEMKRFLMTIPEAAQLVIQAGAMGENGDLFILDMGAQVNIDAFARTMIRLAGFKPDEEIEIVYTGIRPGEKLYEELVCPDEIKKSTDHPKIFKIQNRHKKSDIKHFLVEIGILQKLAIDMDYDGIYRKIAELLPEYQTSNTECFFPRKLESLS